MVGKFNRISDLVILSILEVKDFIPATSIKYEKVKKSSISIPLLKPIDTRSHAPVVLFYSKDLVKFNLKILFTILKKTATG